MNRNHPRSRIKTNTRRKRNHGKNFRGGRTTRVSPEIRYKNGKNTPIKLTCPKCNDVNFIVKTLTMGTKTKAFLKQYKDYMFILYIKWK